jgi:hypothetical protein
MTLPWAGMQIDVIAQETTRSGANVTSIIECKNYARPVGVEVVAQFASILSLLQHQKLADRGIIVAPNGFTRSARQAAQQLDVELLEFADLKQRLASVSPRAVEQARKDVVEDAILNRSVVGPRRVFVVMPFAAEFQDIYILGIREVAEKLGFVVERADSIEHNGSILQLIQDKIKAADAIIADTTNHNANVFYEIGYAHALNKPTILICRKGTPIPFDVQSVNLILYESIVDLRERLEKRIRGTLMN